MMSIRVTAKQLKKIRDCVASNTSPYEAACEYGFQGFEGGLDHIVDRPWSFDLIDRGVSGGGGYRDNTTRFVVPVADRTGTPPLKADYC